MICTKCNNDTRVIDTTTLNDRVLRKRKCKVCGYVFFTEERSVVEGVAIPSRHQMRYYVRHT